LLLRTNRLLGLPSDLAPHTTPHRSGEPTQSFLITYIYAAPTAWFSSPPRPGLTSNLEGLGTGAATPCLILPFPSMCISSPSQLRPITSRTYHIRRHIFVHTISPSMRSRNIRNSKMDRAASRKDATVQSCLTSSSPRLESSLPSGWYMSASAALYLHTKQEPSFMFSSLGTTCLLPEDNAFGRQHPCRQ
jgi:hypothetical protein